VDVFNEGLDFPELDTILMTGHHLVQNPGMGRLARPSALNGADGPGTQLRPAILGMLTPDATQRR
jgi:hypothetical protein